MQQINQTQTQTLISVPEEIRRLRQREDEEHVEHQRKEKEQEQRKEKEQEQRKEKEQEQRKEKEQELRKEKEQSRQQRKDQEPPRQQRKDQEQPRQQRKDQEQPQEQARKEQPRKDQEQPQEQARKEQYRQEQPQEQSRQQQLRQEQPRPREHPLGIDLTRLVDNFVSSMENLQESVMEEAKEKFETRTHEAIQILTPNFVKNFEHQCHMPFQRGHTGKCVRPKVPGDPDGLCKSCRTRNNSLCTNGKDSYFNYWNPKQVPNFNVPEFKKRGMKKGRPRQKRKIDEHSPPPPTIPIQLIGNLIDNQSRPMSPATNLANDLSQKLTFNRINIEDDV